MTESIARLHIALAATGWHIWRRVAVPVDASLRMRDDGMQGAMLWHGHHL